MPIILPSILVVYTESHLPIGRLRLSKFNSLGFNCLGAELTFGIFMFILSLEIDPLCLTFRMLVRQVPINLSNQQAAVPVAHPSRDGHEVNAAHYARRYEVMSAIMESKLRQPGRFPGKQ